MLTNKTNMPVITAREATVMNKLRQLIHPGNILHITEHLLQVEKTSILPLYQDDAHR